MKSVHSAAYRIVIDCLKDLRIQAGLTQAELAERIGAEQFFVSRYERGQRRLDIIELRAICGALGSSLPDFVQRIESELHRRGIP